MILSNIIKSLRLARVVQFKPMYRISHLKQEDDIKEL